MNSINPKAKEIVGTRPTTGINIDMPAEFGFYCPVCKNKPLIDGEFDERLERSEYKYFLWCTVCNQDYPSCLCCDTEKGIDMFLDCIKDFKTNQ